MRIDIITVLPEMLEGFINESILARAQKKGLAEIHLHNLRDYTRDKWRRVDDYPYGGFAGIVKTGRADDHLDAVLGAIGQMMQRALRAGKVDQILGVGQSAGQIGFNQDAGGLSEKRCGVAAEAGCAGNIERAGEPGVGVSRDRFNQHTAHAAGSAGNGDSRWR